MFPTIHSFKADDLNTQGYGALADAIDCSVSEELNGAFTLELTYPLNGLHAEYLVTGNIIQAKPNHNQSRQPFRISEVKKSFANNIQVYANHISYDMSGYTLRDPRSYSSLAETISAMNSFNWSSLNYYHQFTFGTDMTSSQSFSQEGINTLRAWMGGSDGSILNVYGGEWVYDNFSCFLTSRRGQDTGYRISYGKNLAEYEKQKDLTEYSYICAYWKNSDAVSYSDLIPTGLDCALRVGYLDASKAFDSQPSTAQLNAYATSQIPYLVMGGSTITVTPAQLGNDVIGLGDSVLICYETVFSTRVVKTVWDALAGNYTKLQLGTKKENIADTIKSLSTSQTGTSGGSPITIIIDSALSTTSTNPVQNRVITNALNNKVNVESGKGLSTNDFTTAEKNKLSGIASGAEVNVQSDWNVTSTTSDAYIKNKPTIPTKTSDLTNDSNFVVDASYVHTDNNFTTTEKNKLSGIASGAEVNVQSDWNVTDTTSDAFIKNKPTIPSAVTVDSALSSTSENPVQNKVINSALNAKADLASPAFTGTPTAPTASAGTNTTQIATTAFVQTAVAAGGAIDVNTDTATMGLRKYGNIVELRLYDKPITELSSFTLPATYRPAKGLSVPIVVWYGSKFYQGFLVINTNGTISASYFNYGASASTPASGSTIFGTVTYFLG